jgi:hypothetical protein
MAVSHAQRSVGGRLRRWRRSWPPSLGAAGLLANLVVMPMVPTASAVDGSWSGTTSVHVTGTSDIPAGANSMTVSAAAAAVPPMYIPLIPARLADSRSSSGTVDGTNGGGGTVPAGQVLEVLVAGRGGVPNNAGAAALNTTIVAPADAGFATVFPCGGDPPVASNLNFGAGETLANASITKLGDSGYVCVYVSAAADVLVDVSGAFPPDSMTTLTPSRLADTRSANSTIDGLHAGGGPNRAGQVFEVQVAGRGGVPAAATAAVLNVTIVGAQAPGFATVVPCGGDAPVASNSNYTTGVVIANSSVARLSATGSVCVFTHAAADVVIDAGGYFAAGA